MIRAMKYLSNVRDVSSAQSLVGKNGGVDLGQDVNVRSSAAVVPGNESFEVTNAIRVCLRHATKESIILVEDVRLVILYTK